KPRIWRKIETRAERVKTMEKESPSSALPAAIFSAEFAEAARGSQGNKGARPAFAKASAGENVSPPKLRSSEGGSAQKAFPAHREISAPSALNLLPSCHVRLILGMTLRSIDGYDAART